MLTRLRKALSKPAPAPETPAGRPIYLISMASYPNYGDELITLRWLRHLAAVRPQTPVWLDVREPGLASSLFAGAHPQLRVTNTLFRAIHEHLNGDPRTPADKIKNLASPFYDLGLLDLRAAGSIHLLGGGYLNSIWPHNQLLVEAVRAARDISGARLYATGQGLAPLTGEKLADFDHLSVRDSPSAQALGIPKGLDDAFLLEPGTDSRPAPPQDQEPSLYLCVQEDALATGGHQALIDYTRAQIKHWGIPRERTYYLEAIPGRDYPGYQALQDLVGPGNFIPFAHFWREGFTYQPQDIWITSRFHHHLNAALHGARGVALNGNPGYYDVKHQSILDLGSRWALASPLSGQAPLLDLADLAAPDDFSGYVRAKREEANRLYPPLTSGLEDLG